MQRAKGITMLATVTFSYEAYPANYPEKSPERMAALDALAYTGDTEHLLEMLCDVQYQVTIVPRG